MQLDAIYSEHMVLQRHALVKITGICDNDEKIVITFQGKSYFAINKKNRFTVLLPTGYAGGPYTMTIQGNQTLIFNYIYVGDVYLLGGQSNMEFKVHQLRDAADCISNAAFDNIYYYQTPQVEYQQKGKDYPTFEKARWQKASAETIESFSAIGYYIAKQLDQVGIPIGFVECNKGGTSASCWVDEEELKSDPDLYQIYIQKYYQGIETQSDEEEDAAREDYFAKYNAYQDQVTAYQKKYPERSVSQMKQDIGHTPWPLPHGHKDYCRPAGLYETMFSRISQYTFKAVVYYQGEEDAHNGNLYARLLKRLVTLWRHKLGQIPFFIVQLPKYQDDKTPLWPYIRDAQKQICETLHDCHLVVSIDEGEQFNIHPVVKEKCGTRVGQSIIEHIYQRCEGIDSPKLISYIKTSKSIILEFDQTLQDLNHGKGFMIDDQIVVPKVEDHLLIFECCGHNLQYAFENYPNISIYNKKGTPLSPFILTI